MATDAQRLAELLKPHSYDSMSQDSGMHCKCGSDSRFEQRGGDLPWSSIDEHRAQVVLASEWLAADRAAQRADEREQVAQLVRDSRDAFLSSYDLDLTWVAGWHAATDDHAARITRTAGEMPVREGCPNGPHREPQGPNEDTGMCGICWSPTYAMRPENEQFGLHADDCSLPRRHSGFCVPGGKGHEPTEIVRGWWMGFDKDIEEARERHKDD